MTTVYVLWHCYQNAEGQDQEKMLGVFSTDEKAAAAVAQLRTQPGFKDHPDKFEILDCTIDRAYMTEGFVTVYPGEEPKLH